MSCRHLDEFKIVTCSKCGEPLPRPHVVEKDGTRRAIKGYKTSYRRMSPDQPANTITMNSGVASSDVKIHYSAPRVLTLWEIMILSSLKNIDNCKSGIVTHHPWSKHYSFEKHMEPKDYALQKKPHPSSAWRGHSSTCHVPYGFFNLARLALIEKIL